MLRQLFLMLCMFAIISICYQVRQNNENRKTKEGVSKTKKVPLPESTKTKKDTSNAHNFIDAASTVDARTGSFSFSMTVGHLFTGHRRYEIKLMYSQQAAVAFYDFFTIGNGWYLSIPWIGTGPEATKILRMGDGSSYTVEPTGVKEFMPIRYYDTRDINVSTVAEGLQYTVENKGEVYILDAFTGLTKKLTTREGFGLEFHIDRDHYPKFTVSNGTHVIFNFTGNYHGGTFIISQTSLGTIKYETQKSNPHGDLRKIICHSCTGPSNTFYFQSELPHSLVKKIEHPSGLIEDIEYVEIGGKGLGVAYGVSKITRNPGTNADLLDTKANTEIQTSEFDYDPLGTKQNFLGDGFASFYVNKDSLLETNGGFYEYVTKSKLGNTCTFQYFNKMHLKTKMEIIECDKEGKNKVLKMTLYEYPCPSNYSYENMSKICPASPYYSYPIKITNEFPGKAGTYSETTENTYDDYGNILSTTRPTGEMEEIKYHGSSDRAGQLRLPKFKTHKPAPGSDCLEHIIEYYYKAIPKWNSSHFYRVECTNRRLYIDNGGEKRIIQVTKNTYHTNVCDPFSYGRVKTERKSKTGEGLGRLIKTSYKYMAESARLTSTVTTSQSLTSDTMTKSKIEDMATGLVLEETKIDKSKTIQNYDLEGRITSRIEKSTDKKDKDIKTEYKYHREKDRNSKIVIFPDGRKEMTKLDNANNVLENDVFDDKKPFAINGISNNNKWKKSEERKIYKDQTNNIETNILETRFRYDGLDRIVETEKPDGVTDIVEYDACQEGIMEIIYKYNKQKQKQTIPTCTIKKFGKSIRKSQLYKNKRNLKMPCSYKDSLNVDVTTYDGFNRIHTEETVTYKNIAKSAKETTIYNPSGTVKLSKNTYEGHNLLNTRFYYDTLFYQIPIDVGVAINDVLKYIAVKTLDGFGRVKTETYEGVKTNNTYNNKGQIVTVQIGPEVKTNITYDGFGRKHRQIGTTRNTKVNATWSFLESGKLDYISFIHDVKDSKQTTNLRQYQYDNILGQVNLLYLQTNIVENKNKFVLSKTHDLIGRLILDNDFLGYETTYNYSNKGQLKEMTINSHYFENQRWVYGAADQKKMTPYFYSIFQ